MYEYKFIEVPFKRGFKVKTGDTFKECESAIQEQVKNGWRLNQIILPINENNGFSPYPSPYCYEIIFEKEIK